MEYIRGYREREIFLSLFKEVSPSRDLTIG